MNDRQLENKARMDTARVKKDLNNLVDDGIARLGQMEANANKAAVKAKDDLTTWVMDSSSQFGEGVEKMAADAKVSVMDAASAVTKDVGHGLSQYNAKAQKVANQVPGNFGVQAARYPWVAITLALGVGIILGSMLRPAANNLTSSRNHSEANG